jgi:N-carbamoyl-L-amino-acid hydrolase
MSKPKIIINAERLLGDIHTLATFTEPDTPGWTRRFPSDAYIRGRAWLRQRFEQAGLHTHLDAGGNLLGAVPSSSTLLPIQSGSHTDTVMGGGRYDGILGTLGALEVARAIQESGVKLRHPFIAADYLGEEPNNFGMSCTGSRVIVGDFEADWLKRETAGRTFAQAFREMGGDPNQFEKLGAYNPAPRPRALHAHFELHIEQGPVLEAHSMNLGAVSGIIGIKRGVFEFYGRPDHTGSTPMTMRADALAAAAEVILATEHISQNTPGAVGAVGRILNEPNQINVVPAKVVFVSEVRNLDRAVILAMWDEVLRVAEQACQKRGVQMRLHTVGETAPVLPPPWLYDIVQREMRALDSNVMALPSGAGHDSNHLSRIAPVAMLFVPSVGGRSHCPEEHTAPEHLALGVQALANCVLALDEIDD